MKRLTILAFVLCFAILSRSQDTTKPWTFWYWMYGAVSEAGVKADLQAMKDVGLGGCYLMPIRGAVERPEYQGTADALSDNFWHMAWIWAFMCVMALHSLAVLGFRLKSQCKR